MSRNSLNSELLELLKTDNGEQDEGFFRPLEKDEEPKTNAPPQAVPASTLQSELMGLIETERKEEPPQKRAPFLRGTAGAAVSGITGRVADSARWWADQLDPSPRLTGSEKGRAALAQMQQIARSMPYSEQRDFVPFKMLELDWNELKQLSHPNRTSKEKKRSREIAEMLRRVAGASEQLTTVVQEVGGKPSLPSELAAGVFTFPVHMALDAADPRRWLAAGLSLATGGGVGGATSRAVLPLGEKVAARFGGTVGRWLTETAGGMAGGIAGGGTYGGAGALTSGRSLEEAKSEAYIGMLFGGILGPLGPLLRFASSLRQIPHEIRSRNVVGEAAKTYARDPEVIARERAREATEQMKAAAPEIVEILKKADDWEIDAIIDTYKDNPAIPREAWEGFAGWVRKLRTQKPPKNSPEVVVETVAKAEETQARADWVAGQLPRGGEASKRLPPGKGPQKRLPGRTPGDLDDLGFYSKAQRQVADVMRGPMQGKQLLASLKNRGVSLDELKWTGLDKFLETDKSLAPQEVQQFLNTNRVKLTKTELGATTVSTTLSNQFQEAFRDYETLRNSAKAMLVQAGVHSAQSTNRIEGFVTATNVAREANKRTIGEEAADTKARQEIEKFLYIHWFDTHIDVAQGQAGIKVPESAIPGLARELLLAEQARRHFMPLRQQMESAQGPKAKYEQYTLPGGENYREVLFTTPMRGPSDARLVVRGGRVESQVIGDNYHSTHFTQPNIVFHLRLKDRTTPEGKRVLFIEELQSDWHQQGRQQGYSSSGVKRVANEVPPSYEIINSTAREGGFTARNEDSRRGLHWAPTYEEAVNRAWEAYSLDTDRPPAGPLSQTWHEVGMRWALREAAAKGYDGVAWTTGKTQAERYSGHAEEGQSGFYDEILPQYVSKLSKRFGLKTETTEVRVGPLDIGDLEVFGDTPRRSTSAVKLGEDAHFARLDDASRKAILQDGMPLFGHGTEPPLELTAAKEAAKAQKAAEKVKKQQERQKKPSNLAKRTATALEATEEATVIYDNQGPPMLPPGSGGMGRMPPALPPGKGLGEVPLPDWRPPQGTWFERRMDEFKNLYQGARQVKRDVVSLTNFAFRYMSSTMRKYGGEAGGVVADSLDSISYWTNETAGLLDSDTRRIVKDFRLRGLEERARASQVADGLIKPEQVPTNVADAGLALKKLLDDLRLSSKDYGVRHTSGKELKFSGHSFPTFLNDYGKEVLRAMKGPAFEKAIGDMIKEGKARNRGDAIRILNLVAKEARGKRAWFIEGTRSGRLPATMREWDPLKVLSKDSMFPIIQRIMAVRAFGWERGGQYPRLNQALDHLRTSKNLEKEELAELFTHWWNAQMTYERWEPGFIQRLGSQLRGWQYLTKIATNPKLWAVNSLDRAFIAFAEMSPPEAFFELVRFHSQPWKYPHRLDITRRHGNLFSAQGAYNLGFATNKFTNLLTRAYNFLSEGGNQAFADMIGLHRITRDMRLFLWQSQHGQFAKGSRLLAQFLYGDMLRSAPWNVRQRLTKAGILTGKAGAVKGSDVARVWEMYGKMRSADPEAPLPEAVGKGLHQFTVQMTAPNTLGVRNAWDGLVSPMKVLFQFQRWPHSRVALFARIMRDARKQWFLGNPGPLIGFTLGVALVGELVTEIDDLLKGTDKSLLMGYLRSGKTNKYSTAIRLRDIMARGGLVTVLGPLVYGLGSLLMGPSMRTKKEVARAMNDIQQEPNVAGAVVEEMGTRELPVVRDIEAIKQLIIAMEEDEAPFMTWTKWRTRSYTYLNYERLPPEEIFKNLMATALGGERNPFGTENSKAFELAARHVAYGTEADIDKAAQYLYVVLDNKIPVAGKKPTMSELGQARRIEQAIKQSAIAWSPLPIPQKEFGMFVDGFGPGEKEEAIKAQRRFLTDYGRAVQLAVKAWRDRQGK